MDKEYSKYFEIFHQEKNAFLSGKKKFKKCQNCDNDKQFIEEKNELIYDCGSKNKECGVQFKIQLPQVTH